MRTREKVAALAVVSTLAASLAMLGSAPRWATVVAMVAAIACALPQLTSRRAGTLHSPLLWLFGAAAVFTLLQLIPLPAALVAWLAPVKHQLAIENARALGLSAPDYLPLSYDPPAGWLELGKLAGYAVFAYACTRLAASTRGRRVIARGVAGAGIGVAVCGLAHHLLGLGVLLSVYTPEARPSSFLSPLLNENHMAGFLALSVPLAIALAMTSHGLRRLGWIAGALLCAGQSLLLQSRGAAVALAVGLALMGGLSWWRKRREFRASGSGLRRQDLGRVVPAGIVLACAVVLLATFTAGGVRDELASTSARELQAGDTKVGVWRASAELAGDNTWTGVGRGAFEFAFTRVYHSGLKTYSHVENEYLQVLVDWGLPATAVLALLMLWVGLAALRHWRRTPLEVGALCALATIGVQSAVDFAVELPGVALSVIAVACILLSDSMERARSRRFRWRLAGRIAFIAAALAAVAMAASPMADSARQDTDAVSALLADAEVADTRVIARARAAFARHPSDYLAAARLAQAYFHRARDPKSLALMNRALALNPNHAGLHVFTAKLLLAGGRRDQALIEFALALRYTLEPGPVLADLVRAYPDPATAARGIPVTRERAPVMTHRLETMGRADVALAYTLRCAEEFYSDFDLANQATELALQVGEVELALTQAERAYRDRGKQSDALFYGRALRHAGRSAEAVAIAQQIIDEAAAQELGVSSRIHELLALALMDEKQPQRAVHVIRQAVDMAVGDHKTLARLYRVLARAEAALGHTREAQEARRLAHEHASAP